MNRQLIVSVVANPNTCSEKAMKLLCHTLNAQRIWNNRLLPQGHKLGVWDMHALQDLENIEQENYVHSLQILDTIDLNQSIAYTNLKGEHYENLVRDILFHVVNHATYHRGQIASEMKQMGQDPLVSDYIFYKR